MPPPPAEPPPVKAGYDSSAAPEAPPGLAVAPTATSPGKRPRAGGRTGGDLFSVLLPTYNERENLPLMVALLVKAFEETVRGDPHAVSARAFRCIQAARDFFFFPCGRTVLHLWVARPLSIAAIARLLTLSSVSFVPLPMRCNPPPLRLPSCRHSLWCRAGRGV